MKANFNIKKAASREPLNEDQWSGHETDSQLWKRFKKGDESAFISLYKLNIHRLFKLGMKFTCDRNLVKDCLQDFFADLIQKRQNLSDTDNIYLYLFVAFRRKILLYLRRKKKHTHEVLDEGSPFQVELGAEEKIINAQWDEYQVKKLNKALADLDPKEREAIYYFYFNNMSYQEIAEVFNYHQVSSARRLLYRAIFKIRKHFLSPILVLLAIQ